jgi:hypothetical protein
MTLKEVQQRLCELSLELTDPETGWSKVATLATELHELAHSDAFTRNNHDKQEA